MTNPDRVAFTLFGHPIYLYGVLIAAGIILAIFLSMHEAKRKKLPEDTMLDIFILVIPFGVLGARLYYVLFEFQQYFGPGIPWWKPFAIWEGGLAIFGGIIGGLLALLIYARRKKLCFLELGDIVAPGVVLAQAIGRWGNFFNQEAFGPPVTDPGMLWFPYAVEIDVPWNNGIHYFNGVLCTEPYHMATFFYESLWCFLVFLFLWFFLRKRTKHNGDVFLWFIMLYSFERMFVEGLRGDSLWLVDGAVRVSQALSIVLFAGILIFLIVRHLKEKKLGRLIWPSPVLETGEADTEENAGVADGDADVTADTEGSLEEKPDADIPEGDTAGMEQAGEEAEAGEPEEGLEQEPDTSEDA